MELEFRKGVPVVDSLRINERLEQLRAVDVRSIDKNDLIDLRKIQVFYDLLSFASLWS